MVSLFDQMRRKRLLKQYMIFLSAIILFHSVIYYPLYLYLDSNVLWRNSIWYLLLTEIAEPLAGYLFFWSTFAYLIYVGVRFSYKSLLPFVTVYALGTLLKYALQNACFILIMGYPRWSYSVRTTDLLFSILMDLLLLAVSLLILRLIFGNKEKGRDGNERLDALMPFQGFFRLSNPLQKAAFWMAFLPSLARLLSRGYYDVRLMIDGRVPDSVPEIFLMFTYYLTDCLTALIGCVAVTMMLSYFRLLEVKARIKYDAPQ